MTIYEIAGILSALALFASIVPYIISIVRGKTTPHPVSWVMWSLIGGVTLFFTYKVGARETLLFAFFNFLNPTIVMFLSIRYWKGGFSRFDYICLACSLLAIITYIVFRNASFSLTLNLAGDAFAFLPTIRKTYYDPGSENPATWIMGTTGYLLSIVASVPRFSYGVAVFPIYLTVFGLIMCFLVLRKKFEKIPII